MSIHARSQEISTVTGYDTEHIAQLDGVSKSYNGKQVLNLTETNLAIKRGKFTVITGPSGSGKTTLLRMLQAIETPDTGTVRLFVPGNTSPSSDIWELSKKQRRLMVARSIGVSHQQPHLATNRTLYEVLTDTALRLGVDTENGNRAANIATRLGFTADQMEQKAISLSGGEKIRAALGAVLIKGGSLLTLDETTGQIAPDAKGSLLTDIRMACDAGMSTVMVTHDVEYALPFADEQIVISGGLIQEINTHPAAV